jgi:hypothetical protein
MPDAEIHVAEPVSISAFAARLATIASTIVRTSSDILRRGTANGVMIVSLFRSQLLRTSQLPPSTRLATSICAR